MSPPKLAAVPVPFAYQVFEFVPAKVLTAPPLILRITLLDRSMKNTSPLEAFTASPHGWRSVADSAAASTADAL